MKNVTVFLFSVFTIVLTLTSCENEPLEGFEINDPNVTTGNPGTNTGGTGSGSLPGSTGTSTGDYFPTAIDNEWSYDLESNGATQNSSYSLVNSFSDSGQTVFETNSVIASSGGITASTNSFIYKSGGNYYTYTNEISVDASPYSITQTAVPTLIFLKDNEPVGHTWTTSYEQTSSYTPMVPGVPNIPSVVVSITSSYEILAKDLTLTVGTETFSPVIEIQNTFTSTSIGGTTNSVIISYYAKDIGLIKSDVTGDGSSVQNLTNYILN
jgi:hypothetical protein